MIKSSIRLVALGITIAPILSCAIANEHLNAYVEERIIRIRAETMEGTVWYTPGIVCGPIPGSDDFLIEADNLSKPDRDRLYDLSERHNKKLNSKIIQKSCGV